jgi:hypothetical protein
MPDDPTITRIRTARHKISERYHHDVGQLIAHYGELEQRYQHRVITRVSHAEDESRASEEQSISDIMHASPKPLAGNL